jgi:glyoxylase-like metal-dependent hydrolase (beta-lactamase superfamily II)
MTSFFVRLGRQLAVAAIVCALFPVPTFGSTPVSAPTMKPQAPGYYRIRLGDFEVTVISDGTVMEPADALLTNTTKTFVDETLREHFMSSSYEMSDNCFLIDTGQKVILIDAGAGQLLGPTLGRLPENLKAAGYSPEQIDEIYLTHIHPDHIGGLVVQGRIAFPNATLRVDQADIDYWLSDINLANANAQMKPLFEGARASVKPYLAAGKLKPFSKDGELSPGIAAIAAHGHTKGHDIYVVRSKGQTLEVIGDLVHFAEIQIGHPEIAVAFDTDSQEAVATRRRVFDDAAAHGYLIGGAHFSFPGLGHIRQSSAGYVCIPLNYSENP